MEQEMNAEDAEEMGISKSDEDETGRSVEGMNYQFNNVEELLKSLNGYGRFQRILNIMLAIILVVPSVQMMIMFFVAANPSWRCVSNSSFCQLEGTLTTENKLICHIPKHSWKYTHPLDNSIISEFDLICGQEWLANTAMSIQYFGWSVGAVFLGIMADKFGRKNVIFTSAIMVIIIGFISSFMHHIYLFIATRFTIGFFIPGTCNVLFTLMGETVDNKHRPFANTVLVCFYTLSLCLLGLLSYFIRKWKYLLISSSIPFLFIILFYKFVPESVHWLHSRNLTHQMRKVCTQIAKMNEKDLPRNYSVSTARITENRNQITNPIHLFRDPATRKLILVLMYSWFMANVVYYGLFLTADDFHISMHLNFILFSVIEVPTNMLGCFCSDRFGRKKAIPGSLLIGSASSFVIAAMPQTKKFVIARIIFGMVGQGCFVVSFNCLIPWTVEILTTDIRSLGLGLADAFGRMGGTVAPWIAHSLKSVHVIAPFVAIGVLGLTSVAMMLYLPETKDVPMQEFRDNNLKDDE